MKVFMSWSGQRSKLTAELLHDWIKCVIQAAQPWVSSKGIDRGALWLSEINNELKDTAVGIICLTQENKTAPWILFEAGALAKGLATNRVCTLLVDLEPSDIQQPLAQFNHTSPNREGMWSLVKTLNSRLQTGNLELTILKQVFDTYWPQFEADFNAIRENNPPVTVIEPRKEKDILAEILEATRSMSNRVGILEAQNNSAMISLDARPFNGAIGSVESRVSLTSQSSTKNAMVFAREQLNKNATLRSIVHNLTNDFGYDDIAAHDIIYLAKNMMSDSDKKN